MTDTNFTLIADADPEDLPRTLKRERAARAQEAREREAREREKEARERQAFARETPQARDDDGSMLRAEAYLARNPAPVMYGDEPIPAAVRRFDVPFFHLMFFFVKAVIAAIPAIILLGVMLWCAGQALEAQYPELIKMKIMITFPN